MLKNILLTITLLFILSGSAFSQSEYTSKGHNGIGLFLNFENSKEFYGGSAGLGLSINGNFDLGIAFGGWGRKK